MIHKFTSYAPDIKRVKKELKTQRKQIINDLFFLRIKLSHQYLLFLQASSFFRNKDGTIIDVDGDWSKQEFYKEEMQKINELIELLI